MICNRNQLPVHAKEPNHDVRSFQVATYHEKEQKTINLNNIKTAADLAALKKIDPFMYYSIPEVARNAIFGKEVNLSQLTATSKSVTYVKRRSSISFERIDIDEPPVGESTRTIGKKGDDLFDYYMCKALD